MDKDINLCKILKGREGETLYSRAFGICQLIEVLEDGLEVDTCNLEGNYLTLYYTIDGKLNKDAEQDLFPSKDQRDWNKWVEEQNKVPKTWSELVKINKHINYRLHYVKPNDEDYYTGNGVTPIEKSALALLKIHQLIEHGYGGNVTNENWKNPYLSKYDIVPDTAHSNKLYVRCVAVKNVIAFHTEEQAKEFLSKPENIGLLKDYFMI